MPQNGKMPQAELLQSFMDSFTEMSTKVSEFQKQQIEQVKKLIEINVNNSKTLSGISNQENFASAWSEILKNNGAVFTQFFLDNLKNGITIWCESCDSSALNSGKLKDFSIKFLDFYSQLVPSHEMFELNSLTRNAAAGNMQAIESIKELVKKSVQQFGDQVKNSAEQMNNVLSQISKQTKK